MAETARRLAETAEWKGFSERAAASWEELETKRLAPMAKWSETLLSSNTRLIGLT